MDTALLNKETYKKVDEHVGDRLRMRRAVLNISQSHLAEKLDISFQQLQKYEKGTNRIAASKLFYLAEILDVDISYFYEGLTQQKVSSSNGITNVIRDTSEDEDQEKQMIKLLQNYNKIQDPKIKDLIFDFVRQADRSA